MHNNNRRWVYTYLVDDDGREPQSGVELPGEDLLAEEGDGLLDRAEGRPGVDLRPPDHNHLTAGAGVSSYHFCLLL